MSGGISDGGRRAAGASRVRPRALPLGELRAYLARLEAQGDEAALGRLERALRGDRRAGARRLAMGCRRRLAAATDERARMEALFARRAALRRLGATHVAGVDEVGVGPLAGPVVAAAVVLRNEPDLPGLDDSKKLTPAQREALDEAIRAQAVAVSVGCVEPAEIDRLNIYHAALEAMRRAVVGLFGRVAPDHLLVDARTVPGVDVVQTAIVHGDAEDASIAAASIVAKVHRDGLMRGLDARFPGYGLARHKGYPTVEHIDALRRLGASPIHRRSFGPVAAVLPS